MISAALVCSLILTHTLHGFISCPKIKLHAPKALLFAVCKPSYLPSHPIFPQQPVTLQAYLLKLSYNTRTAVSSKSCICKGECEEDLQVVCRIRLSGMPDTSIYKVNTSNSLKQLLNAKLMIM